jgi:hypothetical protein
MARVRFEAWVRDYSLLNSVQIDSGANTDSYTMSAGAISLRCEADHSPPYNAEVKNGGVIPSLPHTSS